MALTDKQRLFCAEYIVDLNATQAAIRAGYSEHTARQMGTENLSKPVISAEIERLKAERLQRVGITADRVLIELARLAYSDPRKLYREDGSMKPPAEWDDDTAASVSAVETEEHGGDDPATVRRVKRWDKKSALELLGKHLGIFADRDSKAPAAASSRVVIEGDEAGDA